MLLLVVYPLLHNCALVNVMFIPCLVIVSPFRIGFCLPKMVNMQMRRPQVLMGHHSEVKPLKTMSRHHVKTKEWYPQAKKRTDYWSQTFHLVTIT